MATSVMMLATTGSGIPWKSSVSTNALNPNHVLWSLAWTDDVILDCAVSRSPILRNSESSRKTSSLMMYVGWTLSREMDQMIFLASLVSALDMVTMFLGDCVLRMASIVVRIFWVGMDGSVVSMMMRLLSWMMSPFSAIFSVLDVSVML